MAASEIMLHDHDYASWLVQVHDQCSNFVPRLNLNTIFCELAAELNFAYLTQFVPIYPFSIPLKTSENCKVFWCFQGVEKGALGSNGLINIRNEWGYYKSLRTQFKKQVAEVKIRKYKKLLC